LVERPLFYTDILTFVGLPKIGTYVGRIAVRSTGSFNISTAMVWFKALATSFAAVFTGKTDISIAFKEAQQGCCLCKGRNSSPCMKDRGIRFSPYQPHFSMIANAMFGPHNLAL
jgi:hypothetical protein